MDDYNFWADLLTSYRASPDLIKALWVLVPPAFLLGLVAVLRLTRRAARARVERPSDPVASAGRFIPQRYYETAALPPAGRDEARVPISRSPSG